MAINLLGEITKKLDIEFEEIFRVKNSYTDEVLENHEFYFGPVSLYSRELSKNGEEKEWFRDDVSLRNIITGLYDIVRLPFEPKMNEAYYTYDSMWEPSIELWTESAWDYINKECEMVFRNEKELIAMRPQQYYKLTGKKWEETNND